MTNELLDSITRQLQNAFGDVCHYYVEDVAQDLKKPCFVVKMLELMQRMKMMILYDMTLPVVIHYFHNEKRNVKKVCYEMAERVVEALEYIPFGDGLIRGENIRWRIENDVLMVFATYRFTTEKVIEQEPYMEILKQKRR